LYKILVKNHRAKQFDKTGSPEQFARLEAENRRVQIKPEAVRELVALTGGDNWRIASEIAKFQHLDKLITVDLVRQIVEPELEASAFGLLDDLLAGRRDQALKELAKLRQIEDANRFLGLLASQVFALAAAVNAGSKTSAAVAGELGVHQFVMSKMFTVARKVQPAQIAKMSQIVAETDAQIKSSSADAWTLLELAISKF
jgi:DNA polymerase-3 subunit delta